MFISWWARAVIEISLNRSLEIEHHADAATLFLKDYRFKHQSFQTDFLWHRLKAAGIYKYIYELRQQRLYRKRSFATWQHNWRPNKRTV